MPGTAFIATLDFIFFIAGNLLAELASRGECMGSSAVVTGGDWW